jgi:hypothetical protein
MVTSAQLSNNIVVAYFSRQGLVTWVGGLRSHV